MNLPEDRKKYLKRFPRYFILITEGFGYIILVPLLLIYSWVNLNLSLDQIRILLICTAIAAVINCTIAVTNDIIILKPVLRYFKKILSNEEYSRDEYRTAQKRFFSLPYLHGFFTYFHWVTGLLLCIVPFNYLTNLTPVQTVNMWLILLLMPPMGALIYFFLSELIVQRYLNMSFFEEIVIESLNRQFSIISRIACSLTLIQFITALGFIGYYSIIIEAKLPDESLIDIKLVGIIIYILIISLSTIGILSITIRDKIQIITGFLRKVGEGDLSTNKRNIAVIDELTKINQTIFIMKKNIMDMIQGINSITGNLDRTATEITSVTDSFTDMAQRQAATVEEVTASIEQISSGMDSIAQEAQEQVGSMQSLFERMETLTGVITEMENKISRTTVMAGEIASEANTGEASLKRMNESMRHITESSQQMISIISIINDISEKINLLSLNASIEAARAGEFGRGFAVVADEISKLADNTAESVKSIDALIKATDSEIEKGFAIVTDVASSMERITARVGDMNTMIDEVSDFMKIQVETNRTVDREATLVRNKSEQIESATKEQKIAINEIVSSVFQINELTQAISAGSEEIAANTHENAQIAGMLKDKVSVFKLGSED